VSHREHQLGGRAAVVEARVCGPDVAREASPHDGRASLLSLTDEGAAKAAAARAARAPLARELGGRNGGLAELTEVLRGLRLGLEGMRDAT